MDDGSLYHRDIYTWAETQAAALRRLAENGADLPSGLDIENLLEEIEDVGRVRLHRVEDIVEPMLRQLLTLALRPDALAAPSWRTEIKLRHRALMKAWMPSIGRELDLERLWSTAARRAAAALDTLGMTLPPDLPIRCPFLIDDLLAHPFSVDALTDRIRTTSG